MQHVTDTLPADVVHAFAAWQAEQDRLWANAPSVQSCPSWCVLDDGHAFDGVDAEGTFVRSHTTDDRRRAWLVLDERVTADGVVTLGTVNVQADYELGRNQLDAEQARALASDLVRCANLLDTL